MNHAETRPSGAICPVCGGSVSPQTGSGRPRRYCSSACKSRAARERRNARGDPPPPRRTQASGGDAGEQLRASRRLTGQAAVELVAADPAALNAALLAARRVLVSPTHRASSWGEVAGTVKRLAAAIPDDIG